MMSKNLTDVLLSCTFELWLHFAHVLMAASTIQFHLVLWPLSGQKVKWLPHEKNRNYPLNPLQDSFKAAVISFYPTTKRFYSSLRHVDADWVWRHQLSAEEEDLWGRGGGLFFLHYLTKADGTRVLPRHLSVAMMLIHSECEPDLRLSHPKAASSHDTCTR